MAQSHAKNKTGKITPPHSWGGVKDLGTCVDQPCSPDEKDVPEGSVSVPSAK